MTQAYEIEKGVDLPKKRKALPFGSMSVGDCFRFDKADANRVRAGAAYARRKGHGNFSVSVRKSEEQGICWRIS